MEKYRRVRPAREPLGSDEVRVTAMGRVFSYVAYAASLLEDHKLRQLTIKASGNAIGQAIALAEQLKRRYRGLHQLNTCGNTTVALVYEPLEEGLDTVTDSKTVAFLEIKLSFDPLDASRPGYQPPLDDAAFEEFKHAAPAPQNGGQGRGRGGYRGGAPRGRGGGGAPRAPGGEEVEAGTGDVEGQETETAAAANEAPSSNSFRARGRGRGGFRGGFRGGYRGAPRGGPRGPRGGRAE